MPENSKPKFEYRVGWSPEYSSLLRNSFEETTPFSDIPARAKSSGRVMLVGKGGSGKTTITTRLTELLRKDEVFVCRVDLKHWSPPLERDWSELGSDVLGRADLLLRELGQPRTSVAAIDELLPEAPKYVFFDGLNETKSAIAEQIIAAADRLAGALLNLSVVATDRLIRRETAMENWQFARVLPLDEQVCRDVVEHTIGAAEWTKTNDSQKRLLENPFFLDKAIEQGSVGSNLAEQLGRYFQGSIKLNDTELQNAAHAAFNAYLEAKGSRTFDLSKFRSEAGPRPTDEMAHSGILVTETEGSYFAHHLFHDYLAALYLANHSEAWGYAAFNAVTFNASSFDAISLILQLLPTGSADEFIRRVYDWHPYAAAYAIADVEDGGVSDEMEFVIAAMLAERLRDIFLKTAERSSDALSILGTAAATQLRDAPLQEMLAFVSSKKSDASWFREWQKLFTESPNSDVAENYVALLSSSDPILGWTAANVIRRLPPNSAALGQIKSLATEGAEAAVRWRAVHALGAFPSKSTRVTLQDCLLTDPDEWVRYGAIRSIMENAARNPQLRRVTFDDLAKQADAICKSPKLRDEFSRAVLARVVPPTQSWLTGVGKVLSELAARTDNRREFEQWVRLGDSVEAYLAAAS